MACRLVAIFHPAGEGLEYRRDLEGRVVEDDRTQKYEYRKAMTEDERKKLLKTYLEISENSPNGC